MAPTARKRVKVTASGATPLVEAFTRLCAQLAYFEQISSSTNAEEPAELERELATLNERTQAYRTAASRATTDDEAVLIGWKDELDSKGTLLWNKSTALKHTHVNQEQDPRWLVVVAGLRLAAYRLVCLGALEPLSSADRLSHLSLATKAATALLAADRISLTEPLLTECAKLVGALEQDVEAGTVSAELGVKGLLAYFCFRMRAALAIDKISLVYWAVKKAQGVLQMGAVSWRDMEVLVQTVLDVASALLRRSRDSAPDSDDCSNREMAREWLQWILELLEEAEGQDVRVLQVAALKLFAQACLAETGSTELAEKAEMALQQALNLEPSPTLYRRLVKLVMGRNGTDAEITDAFVTAAKSMATGGGDGSLLLSTLEQLPASRSALRIKLLGSVVAELATWPIVQSVFLEKILATAAILATEADKASLSELLHAVDQGLPKFSLSAANVFTCATRLRHFGDRAFAEKRYRDAADWYLLATSSPFRSLPFETMAKSVRKAALCFLQAEKYDEVEKVMQLIPRGDEQAKDYFILFCARQANSPKALATLKVMIAAPGFSPSLLQWAYKLAVEHKNKDLSASIISLLYDVCQAPELAAGIDYMVLTRSVIRQHIELLQDASASQEQQETLAQIMLKQVESGLLLVRRLKDSEDPPASLGKEVAWLYKTSFNLCAEYCARWSLSTSTAFFRVTVALIELAGGIGGNRVDANKLWTCKMAVVAGEHALASEAAGQDKKLAYPSFLKNVNAFLDSLRDVLADSPPLEKADELLEVGYAAKVDALAYLEDWNALIALVETFEENPSSAPLSIVKLVVHRVTQSPTCTLEHICPILRKTLALLYGRQDLDIPSMALWLRVLVAALIGRRDLEQAFEYVQNAQQFIEQHQNDYPEDEASWMLSVAWDKGLDAFAASSPLAGAEWCTTSIAIARAVGSPLVETLEDQLEQLKERYVVKEEEQDEDDLLLT